MAGGACVTIDECRRVRADYVAVRVAGKLLFRYDPRRRLVQIKRSGGDVVYIDLAEIDSEARREVAKDGGDVV